MGSTEELALLQKQLAGLAKAVERDDDLPTNMEDYLVTLNSLKKRIETVNAEDLMGPVGPMGLGGTVTGRMSTKNPNLGSIPRTKAGETSRPPVTDRRAAIEHTRKLNAGINDS